MKKAQGLPVTTIIIAALGILVLVVIAAIFGSQMGAIGKVTKECRASCIGDGGNAATHESALTGDDAVEKCNQAGYGTALTGIFLKPAQISRDPEELQVCAACCVGG